MVDLWTHFFQFLKIDSFVELEKLDQMAYKRNGSTLLGEEIKHIMTTHKRST
jgi:hypothetical protein